MAAPASWEGAAAMAVTSESSATGSTSWRVTQWRSRSPFREAEHVRFRSRPLRHRGAARPHHRARLCRRRATARSPHVGEGTAPAARDRHDLGNALILPGAIDAQVHSLSQKDQEDFIWSTRSAAAGGVTTIVDMPYDEGNLVCSAEAVRSKVAHAAPQARVDFALYGTIDPEEGASRIAEQVEAGVAAFKFSTFGTDPMRFPRIPPAAAGRVLSPPSPRPGSPPASTTRTTRSSAPPWPR